jgi:GNAT superfamily N-acetyltransferase
MDLSCECGATITADDLPKLEDAFLLHVRGDHPEWPFPDTAVRNYAAATQRLTGASQRLDAIGEVTVHPVDEARLDDWAQFFDHDGFVGSPEWAACYCTEPHVVDPRDPGADVDDRTWDQNRALMLDLLRSGRSQGYLAYVDGRPAGWVNASKRSDYALFREGPGAAVDDGDVIGLSCFVIAPPYRRHGVAGRLLDRVIADASGRGVGWIEAYPFREGKVENESKNFRGSRSLYDERGFEVVDERERYLVMRRPVSAAAGSA